MKKNELGEFVLMQRISGILLVSFEKSKLPFLFVCFMLPLQKEGKRILITLISPVEKTEGFRENLRIYENSS